MNSIAEQVVELSTTRTKRAMELLPWEVHQRVPCVTGAYHNRTEHPRGRAASSWQGHHRFRHRLPDKVTLVVLWLVAPMGKGEDTGAVVQSERRAWVEDVWSNRGPCGSPVFLQLYWPWSGR